MDWIYDIKRPVDETAIRKDGAWQPGPIPQLQQGAGHGGQPQTQALGINQGLGTGHRQGWALKWDAKLCLGVGYGMVTAYKHLNSTHIGNKTVQGCIYV